MLGMFQGKSQGMKLFLYDTALKELVGRQIPPNEAVLLLDAWDTILWVLLRPGLSNCLPARLAGCEWRKCVALPLMQVIQALPPS